jgi:hypothetical protein
VSFSPLNPGEAPPALLDRTTTAEKRIAGYNAALARRGKRPKQTRREIPGLDVAALAAKYGSGDAQNKTQTRIGTFKVPMGISWARWETYRNLAAARFLKALEDQGWQVDRLQVRPGVYPYRDVLSGKDDPDFREMQIVATCGLRKEPDPVAIHLDEEDVAPIVQSR